MEQYLRPRQHVQRRIMREMVVGLTSFTLIFSLLGLMYYTSAEDSEIEEEVETYFSGDPNPFNTPNGAGADGEGGTDSEPEPEIEGKNGEEDTHRSEEEPVDPEPVEPETNNSEEFIEPKEEEDKRRQRRRSPAI